MHNQFSSEHYVRAHRDDRALSFLGLVAIIDTRLVEEQCEDIPTNLE